MKIPVGGWLSLILGGYIPMGVGFDVGGSISMAPAGAAGHQRRSRG
ncbi:MAG: hypothetical protein IPM64_10285 [Phycisphaerales bacterium]|nr:hypothetical protein [Phycisphaerales bacterium]